MSGREVRMVLGKRSIIEMLLESKQISDRPKIVENPLYSINALKLISSSFPHSFTAVCMLQWQLKLLQ